MRLSSAFIVFPGGIGTAPEMFMVWQLLLVKHLTDLDVVKIVPSSAEAIPLIAASYDRFKEEKVNGDAR